MFIYRLRSVFLSTLFLFFVVCTTRAQDKELRIVSLNGAMSEILAAFGLMDQIVGVDITSIYPEELKDKPQVGHNQNISAEGILAFNPNLAINSALFGAIILTLADVVSRTIIAPAELPIGIITAILGTPLFIGLLLKQKRFMFKTASW